MSSRTPNSSPSGDHWTSVVAGYLLGALWANVLSRRPGDYRVLLAALFLASAAFIACAYPVSFLWYSAWRLISGIADGVLMVLGVSVVLTQVAPGRRGLVGGIVLTGVAVGILVSSTLVPLLLDYGLEATWYVLGCVSFLCAAVSWPGWARIGHHDWKAAAAVTPVPVAVRRQLTTLNLTYAITVFGLVPHMVFLSDYVARGLGQGIDAGAFYWALFMGKKPAVIKSEPGTGIAKLASAIVEKGAQALLDKADGVKMHLVRAGNVSLPMACL